MAHMVQCLTGLRFIDILCGRSICIILQPDRGLLRPSYRSALRDSQVSCWVAETPAKEDINGMFQSLECNELHM
jgi:hypothetical protein